MAASGNMNSRPWAWRESYVAALVEADKKKIPMRIADAERLIVNRAKELFSAEGDNIQEEEALDDALYALRALKICLEINGGYAEAEPAQPHSAIRPALRENKYDGMPRPASN